jgi:hypothetical protein
MITAFEGCRMETASTSEDKESMILPQPFIQGVCGEGQGKSSGEI